MKQANIIISLLSFLLFIIIGCKDTKQQATDIVSQNTIDEVELLSQTPDSLLTKDQLSKKIGILSITKESLKIDGDKLITTATVEDFKEKGLPEEYYSYFLKNIEEINTFMDQESNDITEMYNKLIQDLEAELTYLSNNFSSQ